MSLDQILKEKPEKKELISKNLIEMVKNCMKKDIINLDLVHTALLQALQISSPKDIEVSYLPDVVDNRNWCHYLKNRSISLSTPKTALTPHVY